MATKARGKVGAKAARGGRARKPARAARKVTPVPAQYGSITAGLTVRRAAEAIEFYRRAFGAKELSRMSGPDGKILHAEIRIGDRVVFLSDESPEMGATSPQTLGGTTVGLMHYVRDVDAAYAKAVAAGARATMPPADMFWGDRFGELVDPYGHRWALATRKAILTPRQMRKGMEEWMAAQGAGPG
jgi:PhnB protein